jgi:1-aminocyclopropane-1-carboxylate deaminase/D-cysteine desulfhydrase-like pyridoxal-dependent ACC family enzyme
MPKLQSFLGGPTLLVKRDDLTPFGGGKYRKVSVLIEDACQCGATVLLTQGSIESRHARTTALLARQKGLPCVLVLSPERDPDSNEPTLLECDEGARLILTESSAERDQVLARVSEELIAEGEYPVIIPFSGSAPLTALAYACTFVEIQEQVNTLGLTIDSIIFSSASGGIQAGLELGKRYTNAMETQLIGVTPGLAAFEVKLHVFDLAHQAAAILGIELDLDLKDLCVTDAYVGDGYLIPTPESRSAVTIAADFENLVLDPTYTAKAFAALIDQIRNRKFVEGQTVVFLHTAG